MTSNLDNVDNSVGEIEEEQQEDIKQVTKDHEQEQSITICTTESLEIVAEAVEQGIQTEQSVMINASLQTEYSLKSVLYLEKENKELKRKLKEVKFGVNIIQGNDQLTAIYTGLPTWSLFFYTLCLLSSYASSSIKISLEDELFLVLIRLRL